LEETSGDVNLEKDHKEVLHKQKVGGRKNKAVGRMRGRGNMVPAAVGGGGKGSREGVSGRGEWGCPTARNRKKYLHSAHEKRNGTQREALQSGKEVVPVPGGGRTPYVEKKQPEADTGDSRKFSQEKTRSRRRDVSPKNNRRIIRKRNLLVIVEKAGQGCGHEKGKKIGEKKAKRKSSGVTSQPGDKHFFKKQIIKIGGDRGRMILTTLRQYFFSNTEVLRKGQTEPERTDWGSPVSNSLTQSAKGAGPFEDGESGGHSVAKQTPK